MPVLHFDIKSHIENSEFSAMEEQEIFLEISGNRYPLITHDANSLANASRDNVAIELLAATRPDRCSHYCEIPDSSLPNHQVSLLKIVGPEPDKGADSLPVLYGMNYHIPRKYYKRHAQKMLKRSAKSGAFSLHPKLEGLALTPNALLSASHTTEVYADANELKTPWDTAVSLLFQHPEMATNKPHTAAIIVNQHIAPASAIDPYQYNRVNELALKISAQGPATESSGWARIQQAETPQGDKMFAEFDLNDKNGDPIYTTGQPIIIYDMTDDTTSSAGAPVSHALRSCRDDTSLQNQQWAVNQGDAVDSEEVTDSAHLEEKMSMFLASEASGGFTATNKTPHHGLNVYPDSIHFDPSANTFSIDVKNTYLRQLGSFIEYFSDTEMTKPIENPKVDGDWPFYFPPALAELFETDTKKAVGTVPNVNTIMGIPMPTDPTQVSIPWPNEAQSLRLMFGGIGTSHWDNHVVWPGVILTGVFNYGIPVFFMAAGAAVTNTQWYKDVVSDTEKVISVIAVAFPIVGAGVATGAALGNTKKVLFSFASTIAGLLVAKGMEKLAEYIMAKLVAAQVKSAIPVVGMAFRIASIALDLAQIAVTTGQVLSSPAVLDVDVKRQMQLNFTLHPDPAHGEPGRPETAIWPLVADNCEVIVEYKNGVSFKQSQRLLPTSSNTPLQFVFKNIGWGGEIKITANVYSKNGWLCGKYQSDELPALPDTPNVNTIKAVAGNIKEFLVPLTQDTQYQYKQKLGYNTERAQHEWQVGTVPTASITDLSCSNVGHNLCEPVTMTINQKAYQVGYTFRASGQNIPLEGESTPNSGQMYVLQNISVLSDDTLNERLKFSKIGFKVQPNIAYDTFGQGPSEDKISPLNFVLDSRSGQYHLRHVDLMNGAHNFGLTGSDLKSYGRFYIPHLDAMVIHPSGYAVAVSWASGKMQILKLPTEPVADNLAPEAQIVSGQGILQGLMHGPKAITVSPDGRLLVLETENRRIQAFDTKGNPVPSFPATARFSLPAADYAIDLNNKIFSPALRAQFEAHGLAHIFDFPNDSLATALDGGVLTMTIINAFAEEGVYLTYNETSSGEINPVGSTTVTVDTPGALWTVTDPNKNATYTVTKKASILSVSAVLDNIRVTVIGRNRKWVLADLTAARSYLLDTAGSDTIAVYDYLSYMPLTGSGKITYVDLAMEAKGYIYVLSFTGDGSKNTDYVLDIYSPTGEFLVRSPDERLYTDPKKMQYVSAARMVLDPWRNLFTLNYEAFLGPNQRTEPSVSTWTPTPPCFDTEADKLTLFQQGDMAGIRALFAEHQITLSAQATLETVRQDGDFLIHDDSTSYDCILSLSTSGEQRLFVYNLIA